MNTKIQSKEIRTSFVMVSSIHKAGGHQYLVREQMRFSILLGRHTFPGLTVHICVHICALLRLLNPWNFFDSCLPLRNEILQETFIMK